MCVVRLHSLRLSSEALILVVDKRNKIKPTSSPLSGTAKKQRCMELVSKRGTSSAGRTMFFSPVRGRSTFGRGEEVEEGVVGDRLGDRPHGAAALVLLFLLDGFQRDVLALRPVNGAAEGCLQRRAVTLTIGREAAGGLGGGRRRQRRAWKRGSGLTLYS